MYYNELIGKDILIDEYLKYIDVVFKQEIIKVVEKIEMDIIYFLIGMGGEENGEN